MHNFYVYAELAQLVLRLEKAGEDHAADILRDRMDEIWQKLSEGERSALDRHTASC